MTTQVNMLLGGTVGAIWALAVVVVGAQVVNIPIFALTPTLLLAFLGPGLVLCSVVFVIAVRRFSNADIADGGRPETGTAAEIDARVLTNTLEQVVIALCLWPAIGFLAADDGPGLLVALSVSFVLSRIAFWIGYRRSPALRMLGWSATFYSTILALAWALSIWFL